MLPPTDLLAAAFAAQRRDKRDWFQQYQKLILAGFGHTVFAKNCVAREPLAEVYDAATGKSMGWFPVAPYLSIGPFSISIAGEVATP